MVSIPVDISSSRDLSELEENGVRGRQVRVERIEELNEGESIEWRMVTQEDLGGWIPRVCMERLMPRKLAKVGCFILYSKRSWVDLVDAGCELFPLVGPSPKANKNESWPRICFKQSAWDGRYLALAVCGEEASRDVVSDPGKHNWNLKLTTLYLFRARPSVSCSA
jgi:hypothetical protein